LPATSKMVLVKSRRRTQLLSGIKNLNKLVSYQKYNTVKKIGGPTRCAPNPWAPKYTWAPWGTKGVVHDNCYDYAFGSFSANRNTKSVPGNRSGIGSNGMNFRTCGGIAHRVLSDNPGNVYKMKSSSEKPKRGFYKVMCFVAPSNDFGNSSGDFHWYKEISAIRYRTRPGDSLKAVAKFFHVTPSVIKTALLKSRVTANKNDGRVANNSQELRVLNKLSTRTTDKLPPGRVLDFPVKLWSHKTGWAGGPLIVDASGKTITDPRRADRNYRPGFHYTKFCSAYGVRRGFAKTGTNANRVAVVNRAVVVR
jgi:LysM repeat protein